MPPDVLQTLPGYGSDIEKNRTDARKIMHKLGYGPDNRLKIKVSVRDLPYLRDPAVILIDQLKQVYIDGQLETIEHHQLVSPGHAQGLYRRPHRRGKRARPRQESSSTLRVRCRVEL
jgi:hypothetical protein